MDGRPHAMDAAAKENAIVLQLARAELDALLAARDPLALRILDGVAIEAWATLTST